MSRSRVRNRLKILALFVVFVTLGATIGYVLVGVIGLFVVFLICVVLFALSLWMSDKQALKILDAREITDPDFRLNRLILKVARGASTHAPKAYLIQSKAPNSLALGRNPDDCAIVVTEGLLESLTNAELEGVIGHELAHILSSDTLLGAVTAGLANTLGLYGILRKRNPIVQKGASPVSDRKNVLMTLIRYTFNPLAGAITQFAVSRNREYQADRIGAGYTGAYAPLANALRKIQRSTSRLEMDSFPALSHLFIYGEFSGWFNRWLFYSHPPVEERVQRLERLSKFGGFSNLT